MRYVVCVASSTVVALEIEQQETVCGSMWKGSLLVFGGYFDSPIRLKLLTSLLGATGKITLLQAFVKDLRFDKYFKQSRGP